MSATRHRRPAALCAALAAAGALALASGPADRGAGSSAALGPGQAAAADCVPVQRSKTVVKRVKVKRGGRVVKVKRKRKKRWTVCVPAPPAPSSLAPCPEAASVLGIIARDDMEQPRYSLSRPCVSAGAVTVQLSNQGEDPHHVFLRPAGLASAEPVFRIPDDPPLYELPPGGVEAATVDLTAGDWYLWCDLLLHEDQGMHATLQVR